MCAVNPLAARCTPGPSHSDTSKRVKEHREEHRRTQLGGTAVSQAFHKFVGTLYTHFQTSALNTRQISGQVQ